MARHPLLFAVREVPQASTGFSPFELLGQRQFAPGDKILVLLPISSSKLLVAPSTPVHSESHLTPGQRTEVAKLQQHFPDVFSPLPGRTTLKHCIETPPGVSVRSRPYRLPEQKRKIVKDELKAMLEMGVIEESHSIWASPIVLVNKPDGAVRFCVKVNSVSKCYAFPMPRVDELQDWLGTALFFDTGFNQGQIPLSTESKEKSAFSTSPLPVPYSAGYHWAAEECVRSWIKQMR